jgi:tetratricopeptide (TPR) repeat protein
MKRHVSAALLAAALAAAGCATHKADWSKPLVSANVEAAAPAQSAVEEGDALWAERGDETKLAAAIAKWEEAAATAPSAALATKLARAHYLLGDGYRALADDEAGRDAGYQKGLDWATTALKLSAPAFADAMAGGAKHADAIANVGPDAIDAMYWYAANLGKWAAAHGLPTKLKYKEDIKATMLRVKALDETFFYAAGWRYFGGFEAATAGLAGGSLEKSEQNFKKAVELAPQYLGTKVLWADYLCTKKQDRATFVKLLEEVVAADASADPAIAAENRIEQAKAKKLLAKVDDLF